MMPGKLYIVATPIGNLGDITLRALETLKAVDVIAAEDTRHTQKLLNHYEIKTKTISFHEYSDARRRGEILELLKDGKSVALVSDAGTPVISDPGYILVKECAEAGALVESIPGACAAVSAVALSGLDCANFVFAGFLETKQTARRAKLERLKEAGMAAVLYDSPNRVVKTLEDVCAVYGGKTAVCVARELTKVYEEVVRANAEDALAHFSAKEAVKGEFVIIIGSAEARVATDEEIVAALRERIAAGATKKDAVTEVTTLLSCSKNKVYKLLLSAQTD